MFPRFLMTETMQKIGLVTFNAWALDGYLKVFWREAPLVDAVAAGHGARQPRGGLLPLRATRGPAVGSGVVENA